MGLHRLSKHAALFSSLLLTACETPPAGSAPAESAPGRPELELLLAPYRPDDSDSNELFRFDPGHDVEQHDGERVRVHFTRTGPDAVRLTDDDANGVPDPVERVAETYDEVLTFFEELGFRSPLTDLGSAQGDGGDGRLDVYLIDFNGASDGAWVRERCESGHPRCSGYVVQENDFAGYGYPNYRTASRILASHELFHAVQAAYDADQGANWSEATAVWASERFDPSLSDLEHFAAGWLDNPDRSIDSEPVGPVASYSYGLGIFAQFLQERWGDGLHTSLWEALEDGAGGIANPHWLTALVALLASDFGTTFETEWVTFATWALRAGYGDAGGPTFASAKVLPRIARDAVELPFSDDKLRVYATSMQVWSARGGALAVALVSTTPGDTDGLVLVTALRKGDQVRTFVQPGLEASIDGSGSDEVIVAVVSTNLAGNSKRPGFCFGAALDAQACESRIAGVGTPEPSPEAIAETGPEEDSESGVESAPEEAPADGAAELLAEPEPANDDGGCAGGTVGAAASMLAAVLGLGLHRLRRRVTRS